MGSKRDKQAGPLKVPLPFDEALKAATEVKPPESTKRKPRKKAAKKQAKR